MGSGGNIFIGWFAYMCGISGYYSFQTKKMLDGDIFYRAHQNMAHRGPDDEGFLTINASRIVALRGARTIEGLGSLLDIRKVAAASFFMGHVRLSIIDASQHGHQPMVDESGNVAIAYNGEVYNYRELREELKRDHYEFRTESDTEVVLKSYLRWGIEAFQRFNGMWAIAIYDARDEKFILCRDRFGVKPLYYCHKDGQLIYASEMKVILPLMESYSVNGTEMVKYIDRLKICDGEETFINDILEVEPGSYIIFDLHGRKKKGRYWFISPEDGTISGREADEKFAFLFEDSVRLRMRSDMEVGSLLSGGLDSSTIVGTLGAAGFLDERYRTFSSVYTDERYSEKMYIDSTNRKWNIRTDFVYMDADTVCEAMDDAIYHAEMPLRAVPMVLQYILYRYISENSNVKVVLNGQGADELFGGYESDYCTRFLYLLKHFRFKDFIAEKSKFKSDRKKSDWVIFNGMRTQYAIPHSNKDIYNSISFDQIIHSPLREYLAYDDRAAMAFGIENRVPFLDYRLVEFAFTLNPEQKINKAGNKVIVRRYGRGIVDEGILGRKDKMGFVSPQENWQQNEWGGILQEAFERIKNSNINGLDGQGAYQMYKDYRAGQRGNWDKVWRYFCAFKWFEVMERAFREPRLGGTDCL